MPTYSYRCTECTNAFDIHQAFTDDSLSVCPVCGGKLRKVCWRRKAESPFWAETT